MEWKPWMVGSGFYAARNAVPANVRRAAFESYVSDPVDGATPLGIVGALGKLKKGQLLSPASTQKLLSIMSNTKTGRQRLKGGLAEGWTLAHKTGTGQVLGATQSGYNDIGIITGPDGRSYSLAVMIRRTSAPIPTRMALMQNVTRATIDYSRNFSGHNMAQGYAPRMDSGAGSN
jgi:beta-lactamase class A